MNIQDVLAAIGVVINGVPQMILALAYGFKAFPTGLGYIVGIIACLFYGSSIPISMQAETITLAGNMGKDIEERLSMVFLGGLIMAILGMTGLLSYVVDLAGERVINGMMAGVGIILAKVAIANLKQSPSVTIVSIVSAIITYFVSHEDLVVTIAVSVIIASVYANLKGDNIGGEIQEEERKLSLVKPKFNGNVVRGALALACLTIGANIAFGNITASLGAMESNVDHLTIYSGLADVVTSLFGGAPVESIISATGAAPNPMASGILMMAIMAAILFAGLLPKIGRYVPAASISGFLLVLGCLVTVPTNGGIAFAGAEGAEMMLAGIPLSVTAISDPFFGLIAGILFKLIIGV